MRTLLIASGFALAMAVSAPILASNDDRSGVDVPRDQWLSVSQIAAKLEAMGYQIREIETEDGVYEVEAVDKNGQRVEAYVHPATGEILKQEEDD